MGKGLSRSWERAVSYRSRKAPGFEAGGPINLRAEPHQGKREACQQASKRPPPPQSHPPKETPGQPSLFHVSGGGPLGSQVSSLRGTAWIRLCHCPHIAASGNNSNPQHELSGLGPVMHGLESGVSCMEAGSGGRGGYSELRICHDTPHARVHVIAYAFEEVRERDGDAATGQEKSGVMRAHRPEFRLQQSVSSWEKQPVCGKPRDVTAPLRREAKSAPESLIQLRAMGKAAKSITTHGGRWTRPPRC